MGYSLDLEDGTIKFPHASYAPFEGYLVNNYSSSVTEY